MVEGNGPVLALLLPVRDRTRAFLGIALKKINIEKIPLEERAIRERYVLGDIAKLFASVSVRDDVILARHI